jgi:hypothetical protein
VCLLELFQILSERKLRPELIPKIYSSAAGSGGGRRLHHQYHHHHEDSFKKSDDDLSDGEYTVPLMEKGGNLL